MNEFLIELILGLLAGLFFGITGIQPLGIVLIILNLLGIGDYKKNLGAIFFLNLFPITIGSVYEFYKSNQINYSLGFILLSSIISGGFIGSKFVAGEKNTFSTKTIKYITAYLSLFTGYIYLISAYYEKN